VLLFPGAIIPIDVGRRKSVRLVEDAIAKERPVIGILTQKDARTEDPASGDLYLVGCAARILKVIKLAKDNFSVILQGVSRLRCHASRTSRSRRALRCRPTSSDRARCAGDEPEGHRQARREADARVAQGSGRSGR
jgi:ATP-dependent Lon protease